MAPRQAAPIPVGVQPVGSFFSLDVDIRGLAALANKLYGYVSPGEAIIDEVEETIKRLVRHAGWRGSDANEFQDAWTVDAGDARKLSMFIDDVAKMMDDLASALAELQIAANNRKLDYEQKSSLSPTPRRPGKVENDAGGGCATAGGALFGEGAGIVVGLKCRKGSVQGW